MKNPTEINIIIGCEESQVICTEFRKLGFNAFSNDIQECSGGHPEWHLKMDVFKAIKLKKWDLGIFHPPCTYLSYAGISWWNDPNRLKKRLKALNFFAKLWLSNIPHICIENPSGCASPTIAKYSQIIQPYFFGNAESKRTCLWLKNLPLLKHSIDNNLFEKKIM